MPDTTVTLGPLPVPAELLAWAEAQPEGLQLLVTLLLLREQRHRQARAVLARGQALSDDELRLLLAPIVADIRLGELDMLYAPAYKP
jgi:hypothetical protein